MQWSLIYKLKYSVDANSDFIIHFYTASGERDMILMHHDVGIKWPDNSEETRHISLPVYGQPIAHGSGYLAMAATVGFPTGIAAKMILDGRF